MDDSIEVPFVHDDAREASAVIAGYVYQVQVTMLRWLTLKQQEELHLECGEDIDRIQRHLATGDSSRTMEQVKNLSQSVGLRSPKALASVVYFHRHKLTNPTQRLKFRYVTTAGVHGERDSPFQDKAAGIIVWHEIWTGRTSDSQLKTRLDGIRTILRTSSRPPSIQPTYWSEFQSFVANVSDEQLLDFVRKFEWTTDYLPAEEVDREIRRRIETKQPDASTEQVEELYFRLFVFVFKTLAQSGRKQLTEEVLKAELLRSSVRVEDRELFSVVRAMFAFLNERLRTIETQQAKMFDALKRSDRSPDLARTAEVIIEPPPLVGKVVPRVAAVETVESLISRVTWCALHGESSCGKSQLVALVALKRKANTVWIRLRDQPPESCSAVIDRALELASGIPRTYLYEQWFGEVCQQLSPQTIVVLDDLPRTIDPSLEIRLVLLGRAAAAAKLSIISISYDLLPPKLRDSLGNAVEELATPNFSDQDIVDLLEAFGAPREQSRNMAQIVATATRRHAWLVRSAAQHLAARNWILDMNVLKELFSGDFAIGIEEQIRRSLLATTTVKTRDLLYRLLLCGFVFTREDVDSVANVRPQIGSPMDELNPALGLWVVQEGPNVYSTSALLHQLGSGLLPPTKAHVHLALGRAILKKRRLSMADGMQAFRHLFAAGDREQPPRILLKALKAFVESPRPVLEDHWGFTLIWVDHALPSYIPLPMRLLLRAYQVVARHRHGDSTTFLFHDLDLLLEQATSERLNDVVAATTGLVTVEIGRDYPSKSNEYILKMLNLLPTVKLPHGSMKPSDSSRAPISGEVGPESLLWVTASGIKNPTELADWLATVSKLTEEQRKRLFASSLSGLQTFFLCHSIWDRERIKPPNLQDWQSVLSQLLAVESLARSTDNELLLGSAVRARITTLGEFLNDADQAQSVASEAYSSVQPHGSAALLISEAAARVLTLRKKSFEAKEWALRAVIAEAGEFGLIKRDALLLLSRLLLPTEASAASEYCRQAVELVRSGTPYDATSLAQTLGEYSIVLWDSDSFDQSLLALQEAVSILLEGKTETPLLKRLYVLCGHTAGYMASMAQFGAPPTADYVAPIPGMFLAARGASSDP